MNSSHLLTIQGAEYKAKMYYRNQLALRPGHEPWLDLVYEQALAISSGAFIDVGVNVGQSLLKVIEIDASRKYVGFEPQMNALYFVEQFLIENNLENHVLFPFALSNRCGLVNLMLREKQFDKVTSGVASIVGGFRPDDFYNSSSLVYSVCGDKIIQPLKLDGIAMIKIDSEGAELEVVEGLSESIALHQPILLFEVLNHFLLLTGRVLDPEVISFREARLAKLDQILRSLGYSIYKILRKGGVVEVPKLIAYTTPDHSDANHVAVHSSKVKGFWAQR